MLLLLIGVDKFLLLNRVSLPEEAGGLVVADADAMQQVPHPPGRISDVKGLVDPVTDLLGGEEAAGGDLGLESLDLGRLEIAGVPLMVQETQGLEALGAIETEPLADLPLGHTEELGDLVLLPALGDPEDSGETLSDAFVVGHATAAFDLLADLRFQCQCHSSPQDDTTGRPTSEDSERSGDCRTFPFAEAIRLGHH